MSRSLGIVVSIVAALTGLTACGGGSSGGGLVAPSPPPPPTGNWQPGVFLAADTFRNRCVAPRSGTDPTTGQLYNEIQGNTLDENNFLRSFTNDTYLWYDEIADQNPAIFTDPTEYFEELRTFQSTPSGTQKDQFSFSFDTLEWFNLFQGGVSAGYGVTFSFISTAPPRQIVVAYTEPNSPASAAGVLRGASIQAIDGFDIDDNTQAGVDAINDAIFPDSIGESHTFEILDAGAAVSRSVTLTTETITEAPVQNVQVHSTPTGDVGYLTFNSFTSPSEGDLVDAFETLQAANVDDLVLDLRYNGGGFGFIAGELAYMIAGSTNTAGKTFDLIQFNDKYPSTNPVTGQALSPDPFPTQTPGFFSEPAGQPLPSLDLSRVFILTGPGTCSASELVINGLRGADVEVIIVGSTTCGKPYGFYEEPNCGTSYFPVQFRSVNDKNFGDYADGFVPSAVDDGQANVLGCSVADDFSQPLGDVNENRLEVALAYQAGQGCTTPVNVSPGVFSKAQLPLYGVDGHIHRSPFASNRINVRRQ